MHRQQNVKLCGLILFCRFSSHLITLDVILQRFAEQLTLNNTTISTKMFNNTEIKLKIFKPDVDNGTFKSPPPPPPKFVTHLEIHDKPDIYSLQVHFQASLTHLENICPSYLFLVRHLKELQQLQHVQPDVGATELVDDRSGFI